MSRNLVALGLVVCLALVRGASAAEDSDALTMVKSMDEDGDGRVSKEEVPEDMKPLKLEDFATPRKPVRELATPLERKEEWWRRRES